MSTDLPVTEKLSGKWAKMLDYPDELDNRRVVQNYYTGRIRLPREGSVSLMIRHDIDKNKGIDRVPVWRLIGNREEAKELWRIDLYIQYYRHHQVWGAHFYKLYDTEMKKNGGVIDDFDMLEDQAQKKMAVKANRAKKARDKVRDETRSHRENADVLEKFLFDMAKGEKSVRDEKHIEMKEKDLFIQEEMRERARLAATGKKRKRKKSNGKVGPAEE